MKKLKSIIALLLAVAILLSLCACGKSSDEDKAKEDEKGAALSGYATAEEAFLAYCEGLLALDWERIEKTIHPDILASAYGQGFKELFFSSPEYADRAIIKISSLRLRDDDGMRDSSEAISIFENELATLGLNIDIEDMKTHKVDFDTDYQDWFTYIFDEQQFVIQINGRWYGAPLYDLEGADESESNDYNEPTESDSPQEEVGTTIIAKAELLGQWEVDTEYTTSYTGKSMWDIFGSSFSDGGNQMTFSEDGSFDYYVAWCYGHGSYALTDTGLYVTITDGDPSEDLSFVVSNDGITRIAYDVYGDGTLVFWYKTSQSDSSSMQDEESTTPAATENNSSVDSSEAQKIEENALAIITYLDNNAGAQASVLAQELYYQVSEMTVNFSDEYGHYITDDCCIAKASTGLAFISVSDYEFYLDVEDPGMRLRIWKPVPTDSPDPQSVTYELFCAYIIDFTENWDYVGWSCNDYENDTWYEFDSADVLLDTWSYN